MIEARFYVPYFVPDEEVEAAAVFMIGGIASNWLIAGQIHSYYAYSYLDARNIESDLRKAINFYLEIATKYRDRERYFFYTINDTKVVVHFSEDDTIDASQFRDVSKMSLAEIVKLAKRQ